MTCRGNIHKLHGIMTWGREKKNRELLGPITTISELSIPWNSQPMLANRDKNNPNLKKETGVAILNKKYQFSFKHFLQCIRPIIISLQSNRHNTHSKVGLVKNGQDEFSTIEELFYQDNFHHENFLVYPH